MPCEPATEVWVQLVVHRRMDVGRDLLVELASTLSTEEKFSVGDRRPPHSQLFTSISQALLVCITQRLVVDDGLAVAPARVVARERAVVAIPSRNCSLVQVLDEFICDCSATRVCIHRLMEPCELTHGDGVESDSVPGRTDFVSEWGEHFMLPLAVRPLGGSVPDSEADVVLGCEAQRSIAEDAAQHQLQLILTQVVLLRAGQDLVAHLKIARVARAMRSKDQVVWSAGE